MTDQGLLVSIVVPMYNSEKYIANTIASVRGQTYPHWELILIDDCSDDDTVQIVRTFADHRIQMILSPENRGPGVTRNVGVKAARGRYLAFLDADDSWYPDKLADQLDFMVRTQAPVTFSRYDIVDENDVLYATSGPLPAVVDYSRLLRHCVIRTSSLMYDVEKAGGKVYYPTLRKRQDFVMFLRLVKAAGRAELFDVSTCTYRLHPEGVSSNKLRNIPFQWSAYRHEEQLSLAYSVFLMTHWFFRAGRVVATRRLSKLASTWNHPGGGRLAQHSVDALPVDHTSPELHG